MLRATHFYDLLLTGAQKLAKWPVIPVPLGFRVQPIDPDEVAARLVELALGQALGRVPDMGGPQVSSFAELVRAYLEAKHRRRRVVHAWMPATGRIRAGAAPGP